MAEESEGSKNVVTGVVAAAAGTEVLGLVADLAQVVTIDKIKNYLLVGTAFIVLLGMVALFGPGRVAYRRSAARVAVTGIAIIACGTVAGVLFMGNLNAEAAAPTPTPSPPVGSAGSPFSSAAPTIGATPSAGPPTAPVTNPPSTGNRSGTPHQTENPGPPPVVVRTTVPPVTPLSATMSCRPSCTTSSDLIAVGGSLTGRLSDDHRLMLFVQAPDGRYYPGSQGQTGSGSWSGKVHVGSPNGTEASYDYTACVYDIDARFNSWLAGQSDTTLNQGLAKVPTTGTARKLACRALSWNRP